MVDVVEAQASLGMGVRCVLGSHEDDDDNDISECAFKGRRARRRV